MQTEHEAVSGKNRRAEYAREACAQKAAEATRSVNTVIRYWSRNRRPYFSHASEFFIDFVDPAFLFGGEPFIGIDHFETMFIEWLIFEYPGPRHLTPAEDYVAHPPQNATREHLACLHQLVASQLFSRFIIRDKDAPTGFVVLEDVQTTQRYDVFDPALSTYDRWSTGTLGQRIARYDGIWLPIGFTRLYDRCTPELTAQDGPGSFHPEDQVRKPEAEHASFFLRLIRDVVGRDGRYRRTATIPPDVPGHIAHTR